MNILKNYKPATQKLMKDKIYSTDSTCHTLLTFLTLATLTGTQGKDRSSSKDILMEIDTKNMTSQKIWNPEFRPAENY